MSSSKEILYTLWISTNDFLFVLLSCSSFFIYWIVFLPNDMNKSWNFQLGNFRHEEIETLFVICYEVCRFFSADFFPIRQIVWIFRELVFSVLLLFFLTINNVEASVTHNGEELL
jgi:hypothetical protein